MTDTSAPHARGTPRDPSATPKPGVVVGAERDRLAATLGPFLAVERTRAGLDIPALAERSGVSISTIRRLERGVQRPTSNVLWRLAKALCAGRDQRAIVALHVRLEVVAGSSLRDFSKKKHQQRARLVAELAAQDAVPVVDGDDFSSYVFGLLVAGQFDA
ncbi:helix-turn-helix domain-containing protein [Lentzea sp. NPDC060358]|uniref:helix-turn-helix domain-containing protein n=1 Tax=Lentzea sp. NPDC060358 TaxID=3347103 RepID=UPI0036635EA5